MKRSLITAILAFSWHLNASTMVTNFVWKNPSECKLDSLASVILQNESKSKAYEKLYQFWKLSSICGEDNKSVLKKTYEAQLKWGLLSELKRSLNITSKEAANFRNVIHDKRFQRFMLNELQNMYLIGTKHKMTNFHGMLNSNKIVTHIESGAYSKYSKNDIRRLVEFHVHRSNSGRTFEGNKWGHGAYGSILKAGKGIGVVTRVTWGLEGDPKYEPRHASDEIEVTAEAGLTTLGSDRFAAEILGVHMASNHGRPEQLIVMNLTWTPESQSDFELALTTWYNLDAHHSDDGEEENEIFVGLSGSYKFESHPFEPFVRFFKKLGRKKD